MLTRVGTEGGDGAREDDGPGQGRKGGNLNGGAFLSLSVSLFLAVCRCLCWCLVLGAGVGAGALFFAIIDDRVVVGRGAWEEGMGSGLGAVSDFVTAAFRHP